MRFTCKAVDEVKSFFGFFLLRKLSISKVVSIYTNYLIRDLISYKFSIKISPHKNILDYYTVVQTSCIELSDIEFF